MHAEVVGREAERAALCRLLELTKAGQSQVVLLRGPRGIGKSRLVADVASRARGLGFTVLRGGAVSEGSTSPLLVIRQLLKPHLNAVAPELFAELASGMEKELASLIPQLSPHHAGEVEPDPPDWWQTVESSTEMILRLARLAPLMVAVEDVHWADALSLQVLRGLTLRLDEAPVLFVAAYRDESPLGMPESLLAGVQRTRVSEFELGPLTWIESRALLARLLGSGRVPDVDLADRLFRFTNGNPLYLEQAARAIAEGHDPLAPSRTLLATVSARIEALTPEAGDVLSAAAAIGETFEVRQLSLLLDRDESELFPALRAAVRAGILREGIGPEALEFSHPFVREAAAQLRLRAENIRLHERIARMLWDQPEPRDFGLIAVHAEQAGDHQLCLKAATEAAAQAQSLGAFYEAALQHERALLAMRARGQTPGDTSLADAAEAWTAAGQTARAAHLMDELGDRAEARGDTESMALARAKALRANFTMDGLRRLEELLQNPELAPGPAKAYALAAAVHARSGGLSEGGKDLLARGRAALEAAREARSAEAESVALLAYGHMVANAVDFDEGLRLLAECADVARSCGAARDEHAALINMVILNMKAARWPEARDVATTAAAWAMRRRAFRLAGQFGAKLADIERLTGNWTLAEEHAREAVLLTDVLDSQSLHVARIARATLAADQARWDQVEAELTWAETSGVAMDAFFPGASWRWLRARLHRAVGDLEKALEVAEAGYEQWRQTGEAFYGCHFSELYVTLLRETGKAEAVSEVVAEMQRRLRWLPEPIQRVAHGWVAGAAGFEALELADRDAAASRFLEASETWDAAGIAHRRAHMDLLLARVWLDTGVKDSRAQGLARLQAAHSAFTELGAPEAGTSAQLLRRHRGRATADAAALSEREQEIAALAAEGLTNQEIAALVVLSRRTVENHLARIYAKTGVHTRAGLASHLRRVSDVSGLTQRVELATIE